jgi:hypothetical protein
MKAWILFFLGSLIYFFIRYTNRTDKIKDFNLKYWLKDNYPELIVTFGLDLLFMIVLMDDDVNVTGFLTKFLPEGVIVPAKLLIGAGCGLGIGAAIYELFKSKLAKKKDEIITTP